MGEWYYAVDSEQQGPVQKEALVELFRNGTLATGTLVWTQDMKDWTPADRVESLLPAPGSTAVPSDASSLPAAQAVRAENTTSAAVPAFLYIPISRLIVMSILSCGTYEAYWIYKNWRYVKDREGWKIRPFWRGIFGIFFCHALLKQIHGDRELASHEPGFPPGALATLWVVLMIVANLISRAPSMSASIIACLMPSYLCFVPVQNYINRVNSEVAPGAPYTTWTAGHVVCLVVGLLVWTLMLTSLGVEP